MKNLIILAFMFSQFAVNGFTQSFEGAWQRTYYYDGKKNTTGEPREFIMVFNGFFSSVGQDSTGKWVNTHAGTYELSGKTMKSTVRYSSHPERVGSIQWVDYDVKGDTLTIKWFKKLVTADGQDLTAQMPRAESKYIRAKN
jgi:hypothetical protein